MDAPTQPKTAKEGLVRLDEALAQLDEVAPGVPLLALGQTVFWDEPMKAGLALMLRQRGSDRRFVAGIHDTDYFAKLAGAEVKPGHFRTVPHNDTTTRGLWSAAGEFSTLFGSETVITRHDLVAHGVRVESLRRTRPDFLDAATEAWGWRGIVSLDDAPPITSEVRVRNLLPELKRAFGEVLDQSVASIDVPERAIAADLADQLRALICDKAEDHMADSVSDYYRALLPDLYEFVAREKVEFEATATTELLRFNLQTVGLPRFDLFRLFVEPTTRDRACKAYDDAVQGSEIYTLDRFGTGALPFDLVIPGKGRGTVRLGTRGAVIQTRTPQFLSFKKPILTLEELALAVEAKFGPDCVLIGKAVTLIGMLAKEFVFAFHDGASGYVSRSRALHDNLEASGLPHACHPILRIRYETWDHLSAAKSWFKLPEPFVRAFGAEEICAPSFSSRWREVQKEQREVLEQIKQCRSPLQLIRYLEHEIGGSWNCLATDYDRMHNRLEELHAQIASLRAERYKIYGQIKAIKAQRAQLEQAKGDHFRAFIFEKRPTDADIAARESYSREIELLAHQTIELQAQIRSLLDDQTRLVSDPEVLNAHERRRTIEHEAELKRVRLIRNAITVSQGLSRAALRPGAWWFRLVSPDGAWFRATVENALAYLEPLRKSS